MYDNFDNEEILDDDFEMLDDDDNNNSFSNNTLNSEVSNPISNNDMVDSADDGTFVSSDVVSIDNKESTQDFVDTQPIEQSSPLESMYDDGSKLNYEDELKTARPFEEEVSQPVVEEKKEVTYTNDVMDYDPMLHNDLQTDGNYTITQFDPNDTSDYVPEQTNFDSEDMMEYYSEENVEKEKPKEEENEQQVQEVFNTSGMQYDTNNVDTFNDGKNPSETVVTRFIFNDMDNNEAPMDETAGRRDIGAISVYNKSEEKTKSPTRRAIEMVATVIIFAILILVVSFFPDINKFFTNLRN